MDLRGDERPILGVPRKIAFALAALVVQIVIVVVPWTPGGTLSFSLGRGLPLGVKLANLLSTFAIALALVVGLAISNRGWRAMGRASSSAWRSCSAGACSRGS